MFLGAISKDSKGRPRLFFGSILPIMAKKKKKKKKKKRYTEVLEDFIINMLKNYLPEKGKIFQYLRLLVRISITIIVKKSDLFSLSAAFYYFFLIYYYNLLFYFC